MKKRVKALSLLAIIYTVLSFASLAAELNINTASIEEIANTMSRVGPAKAAAIVEFREQHGPFESIEALVKVKGIGSATVEANRDKITTK